MRVLVTGGTGDVGRAAVARLVRGGHSVMVIGRRSGVQIDGADYASCDILDFESLQSHLIGVDAVVHLAAIRHPSMAPGQDIFRTNCAGTFNVYRAAANAGIRRVVSASSINALGYNFGVVDFCLQYWPIDEDHPTFTTDPYSFSKQIVEEIAAYFWRREGISGICMRLPAVYETVGQGTMLRDFVLRSREATRAVLALPPLERAERVERIVARFQQMREQRIWEQPLENLGLDLPDAGLIFGRSNFWASINALDSAQAIEKALTTDYEGSHPLYINDSHNFLGIESCLLAETFFPEVTTWRRPVAGSESLVSIDRARALIGFEPEHSVREWFAGADGRGPSAQVGVE